MLGAELASPTSIPGAAADLLTSGSLASSARSRVASATVSSSPPPLSCFLDIRGHHMLTTSDSLLHRLRHPSDGEAWARFIQLYTPVLHRWANRLGLQEADAADLVQDVFGLLLRKLPEFE